MAKRGISDLIDSSGYHKGGIPLLRQVPPKVAAAIVADLGEVVKAQSNNRPVPSHPVIANYIAKTYSIAVQATTIGLWLRKLRNGETVV